MLSFDVQDMTCGHCVATVTKAVQAADPGAQVAADLPSHRVTVTPAKADAQTIAAAIREAGYTPVAAG